MIRPSIFLIPAADSADPHSVNTAPRLPRVLMVGSPAPHVEITAQHATVDRCRRFERR